MVVSSVIRLPYGTQWSNILTAASARPYTPVLCCRCDANNDGAPTVSRTKSGTLGDRRNVGERRLRHSGAVIFHSGFAAYTFRRIQKPTRLRGLYPLRWRPYGERKDSGG